MQIQIGTGFVSLAQDGLYIYSGMNTITNNYTIYNSDGSTGAVLPAPSTYLLTQITRNGFVSWATRLQNTVQKNSYIRFFANHIYGIFGSGTTTAIAYNADSTVGKTLSSTSTDSAFIFKYDTGGTCKELFRLCRISSGLLGSQIQCDGNTSNFYVNVPFRGTLIFYNANGSTYTSVNSYNTSFYSYAIAKYSSNGVGNAITLCGGPNGDVQVTLATQIRVSRQGNIILAGGYNCDPIYVYAFGDTLPNTSTPVTLSYYARSIGATTYGFFNSFFLSFSPTQGTQTLPDAPSTKFRYLTTSDNSNATTLTTNTPIQTLSTSFRQITIQGTGSNIGLYWNGASWEVLSNNNSTFY